MADRVILYDIPSIEPRSCWSLNTWKVRAALNYKQIPYETKWIEYPDIAPTLSGLGLPRNPDGQPAYTVPAIVLPDRRAFMTTKTIMPILDELVPSKPLMQHDDAQRALMVAKLGPLWGALIKLILPQTEAILNPVSAKFFDAKNEEYLGGPVAEIRKDPNVPIAAWEKARPAMRELAEAMQQIPGQFVGGDQLGYADLFLVGVWQAMKKISPEDIFPKLMEEEVFRQHCEACKEWTVRNDY